MLILDRLFSMAKQGVLKCSLSQKTPSEEVVHRISDPLLTCILRSGCRDGSCVGWRGGSAGFMPCSRLQQLKYMYPHSVVVVENVVDVRSSRSFPTATCILCMHEVGEGSSGPARLAFGTICAFLPGWRTYRLHMVTHRCSYFRLLDHCIVDIGLPYIRCLPFTRRGIIPGHSTHFGLLSCGA